MMPSVILKIFSTEYNRFIDLKEKKKTLGVASQTQRDD